MSDSTVIFVYNADTGWFNLMADIGHKIFSPKTYPCSLCDLTHGVLKVRKEWNDFVEEPPASFIFWHRDEFKALMPDLSADTPLPVVLVQKNNTTSVLLSKEQLDHMETIAQLKVAILAGL